MRISKLIARWTILFSALAAFSGCGGTPVGPAPASGGGGGGDPNPAVMGPQILVVHPDGTTSWTQLPGGMPAGSLTDPGATSSKLAVVEQVDGAIGAKMRCGRFYLLIPPGAFAGRGSVTMSMEDSTVMVCDLEIYPAELNSFHEPVKLALSVTDTDASTDTLSIYWHDPDKNDWVDMVVDRDLSNNPETAVAPCPANMRGVMTALRHFSKYSGGKAGW